MRKYRKPYRVKKKKSILIWKNRFFWLGILILIIFGGIFYLIFFHSFFQVKVIKISGNQKVATEDLENLLNQKIIHPPPFFWWRASKSIFLVNFGEIRKEILKSLPQIEEIALKRKFPDTILVQVKERKPTAVFCQNATCFFIDKYGIIFEPDVDVTRKDLVTLRKERKEEMSLGEKIIAKEQLSKILEVEAKLKNELKILSEEILVISEERFNAKTLEGWQIYFNFQEDLEWQLTKLKAVLEEEIPQEKRKNLEYIDVRFGNFAPYKYR
ncbi:MAG: FtsQ-type POTRA domain-containing protein [Patescibacteria group bacterium]|nr:FtsQ-type POTRA domain-containing protein [Patescibacteria group bacterium]